MGVVLVSHGPLAEGLRGAAEMIMGPQEQLLALGMDPAADLEALREELKVAVEQVEGSAGVLILADLFGGSPANAAAYLALEGTPVVAGASLPMLLEVLGSREGEDAGGLAQIALNAGRDGVLDVAAKLNP